MWSNFFSLWLQPLISSNQHGYQPGKGVLSCWKFILTDVIHRNNILEFDLKKFFDKVDLKRMEKTLLNSGIPEEYVNIVRG